MLVDLDHVNIRTRRLPEMVAFYTDVLGLTSGPRPAFQSQGAWLYCGQRAVVHLVRVDTDLNNDNPRLEHFALRGQDLQSMTRHLDRQGVSHRQTVVPGRAVTQIHLFDPDGNHIEISYQQ